MFWFEGVAFSFVTTIRALQEMLGKTFVIVK